MDRHDFGVTLGSVGEITDARLDEEPFRGWVPLYRYFEDPTDPLHVGPGQAHKERECGPFCGLYEKRDT
jgi:hypothetical protein